MSGELSTNISRKAFDGFYLKRYMDNASTPNPTIGGMNLNTLEKDEKELKNKEKISLAEYLPYHRKRLEKANAWVDTKIKENSNSEESYEKARDILVDMHFNLGAGGLNKFKKMIRAIGEGDWSKATREIGKKAGGAGNNEYLQVHKRVKGKDVPQVNSDGSPKLIERAVRNKEKLAALIQKPRAKPTPPPREIAIPRSKPKQPQASGGFISLEEGGVAERASSESKGSFYESRQSGFEKLHEQALDLADVRRKQLKGNTLAQGSGNKELDENYQAEFDSLIRNMTYEITAGTESVGGFTKKTSAEEREKLVDQLTAFYEGKANEGITERESLHLDFKEDFNNMPGSERMAEADINMDRTMSKNPDKNPSRQTRAVPNILEQEGSEAYTGFLTPDFNPLATQRNI
jgi:GH24 family phage-related lysozyme (muramidase)